MKVLKTRTFVADRIVISNESDHAWLSDGEYSTHIKPTQVCDFINKLPILVKTVEGLNFTQTTFSPISLPVSRLVIKVDYTEE